jgi:hypothetical protein
MKKKPTTPRAMARVAWGLSPPLDAEAGVMLPFRKKKIMLEISGHREQMKRIRASYISIT